MVFIIKSQIIVLFSNLLPDKFTQQRKSSYLKASKMFYFITMLIEKA